MYNHPVNDCEYVWLYFQKTGLVKTINCKTYVNMAGAGAIVSIWRVHHWFGELGPILVTHLNPRLKVSNGFHGSLCCIEPWMIDG